MSLQLDQKERAFVAQSEQFVALALQQFEYKNVSDALDVVERAPLALKPTIISDLNKLTAREKREISNNYWSAEGVSFFAVNEAEGVRKGRHPIHIIAEQLKDSIPLRYPIDHPLELHPEAISRFGPPDGTRKIYDLPIPVAANKYREQNETSERFDAHNDGLGYAGAIESFLLYADSGPYWGGFTYFQNIVRIALTIAHDDLDAFTSLFLPDAITVTRPRGKGAIRVTSPVLFLGEFGVPQIFFRVPSGEYSVSWRDGCDPLRRAATRLQKAATPFARGSTFLHLSRRGFGCAVRNSALVHGRTEFSDMYGYQRVLARKWYVSSAEHLMYKHVPGIKVLEDFGRLYPDQFGTDSVTGEWHWIEDRGANIRIK